MLSRDENLYGMVVTIQRSWAVARSLGLRSPHDRLEEPLRHWLEEQGIAVEVLDIQIEQGRARIEIPTTDPAAHPVCISLLGVLAQLRHAQVYVTHRTSVSSLGHPVNASRRIMEAFAETE